MSSQRTTSAPVHLARRVSAELVSRRAAVRGDRGQGTVEYVALILLVGAIMTAVVASGAGKNFNIGQTIGDKLGDMVKTVGAAKK